MTTPSIYTVGQLRAYLQGAVSAIDADRATYTTRTPDHIQHASTARSKAFAEVADLCEAIEAYQATDAAITAGHAPISALRKP